MGLPRRERAGTSPFPWGRVALLGAVALYTLLLTPNYDDGVNASHIANTARGALFHNDVFGTVFPFQKAQTVLAALLWSWWPARFLPHAAVHGLLILASCWLFHATARRSIGPDMARTATALLATYLLTHNWLAPTRPEMVLLTVGLAVTALCQRFERTGRLAPLLGAALLVGLLAIPTHPNAAVLLTFLALFLVLRRRLLLQRAAVVGGVALLSGLVGVAIVFAPDPQETVAFLGKIKEDGQRFTFLLGEAWRLSFLFRFLHYRYLSLLLAAVALARLLQTPWREVVAESLERLGLFGVWAVAALATFAVWPAARWSAYVVLHLPWFALVMASQWHAWQPTGRLRLLPPLLLATAATATLLVNLSERQLDLFDLAKASFLIAPALVAALGRSRDSRGALFPVLTLAVAFKLLLLAADYRAFGRATAFLRAQAVPTLVDSALVWTPAAKVHALRVPLRETPPPRLVAVVAAEEKADLEKWLQAHRYRTVVSGTLANSFPLRFISPWLRGLAWYELVRTDARRTP